MLSVGTGRNSIQTPFKKQHGRYLLAHIMPYCLASGKAWSRVQTMQSGISCFSKRPSFCGYQSLRLKSSQPNNPRGKKWPFLIAASEKIQKWSQFAWFGSCACQNQSNDWLVSQEHRIRELGSSRLLWNGVPTEKKVLLQKEMLKRFK